MSRRSSSPGPSPGPSRSKRQKIFRACASCVTSKTRCEDVTPEGCALCRRRSRICSLAAMASSFEGAARSSGPDDPASASSSSLSDVDHLRRRLAEAERRVERTESALMGLEAQLRARDAALPSPNTPRPSHRSRSISQPADQEAVQLAGPLRFATILLYRLDEAMFSVGSTRVYPDPVARNIVPFSHVELAWHAFKARISALLPLPPFLAVSTPVPQHGFVVLAALYHVPSKYSSALEPLLHESIVLAMSGAADVDVMLALLILSLAPERPHQPDDPVNGAAPCTPSSYRLISLAYQMGQSLGYESIADAALQRGESLNREYHGEQLWNLQLWAAIVNRFCLLSLMNGQIVQLPRRIAEHLPVLKRDAVEICNRHLKAEAKIIDMFEPVAKKLCSLEHIAHYNLYDVRELQLVWKVTVENAKKFLRGDQPPPTQRDALCVEFAIGLRIASLAIWIPSPLKDARELVQPCLTCFPVIMRSMLEMITSDRADPASFPSYTLMLAAASLVCLRRAVQFVRMAYRQSNIVDEGVLVEAENVLKSLGRAPHFFLTEANRLLADIPYSQTWEGAAVHDDEDGQDHGQNHNVMHDAPPLLVDFDIMNWDLSVLYPDLAPLGNINPPVE